MLAKFQTLYKIVEYIWSVVSRRRVTPRREFIQYSMECTKPRTLLWTHSRQASKSLSRPPLIILLVSCCTPIDFTIYIWCQHFTHPARNILFEIMRDSPCVWGRTYPKKSIRLIRCACFLFVLPYSHPEVSGSCVSCYILHSLAFRFTASWKTEDGSCLKSAPNLFSIRSRP